MSHDPQAGLNAARNKRIKSLIRRLVREYLEGRSAEACMQELVTEAKR